LGKQENSQGRLSFAAHNFVQYAEGAQVHPPGKPTSTLPPPRPPWRGRHVKMQSCQWVMFGAIIKFDRPPTPIKIRPPIGKIIESLALEYANISRRKRKLTFKKVDGKDCGSPSSSHSLLVCVCVYWLHLTENI